MSRMPWLSGCPSCAEPLEESDRFCGRCGAPVPSGDRPTLRLTPNTPPAAPRLGFTAPGAPAWTAAPGSPPGAAMAGGPSGAPGFPSGGTGPIPGGTPGFGSGGAGAAPGPAAQPLTGMAQPGGTGGSSGPAGHTRYDGPGHEAAAPGHPAHPAGPAAGEGPYGAPDGPTGHATGPVAGHPQPAPAGNGNVCVACRSGHVDPDGYCENCGHAQPRERDHLEESLETVAAVSDRGLRHHRNEDSFAVAATALPDGSAATVAIVCDGVSSASRPDDASAAAAGAANESLLAALPRGANPQQAMHEAILAAAEAVNGLAAAPGHQNAPACTLVGAVVSHGVLVIGWVGDSRAYWVPDDRSAPPARLTEDDSWAAQMVATGLMTEAEAYADARAHAITGWLGADAYELEPHTAAFKPDRPGVVVVCTDGLWNYAESAQEMARVLPADAAERPLHSAQVLVGHALDGGGHDNITVAVVPFPVTGEPAPVPPSAAHADS